VKTRLKRGQSNIDQHQGADLACFSYELLETTERDLELLWKNATKSSLKNILTSYGSSNLL
jgi:hypothetical protein